MNSQLNRLDGSNTKQTYGTESEPMTEKPHGGGVRYHSQSGVTINPLPCDWRQVALELAANSNDE